MDHGVHKRAETKKISAGVILQYINTHTHNHFTALLDFVRDYPSEPAPER